MSDVRDRSKEAAHAKGVRPQRRRQRHHEEPADTNIKEVEHDATAMTKEHTAN